MANNDYLKQLIEKILSLKTEKELMCFLEVILTPKELEEIPARLQIGRLLQQGVSQREIAKKLGVGIATITRGSKELKSKKVKDL